MSELASLKVGFLAGTLGQGGAERQLFYMIQSLRARGADVRVLSLGNDEFWHSRIRELSVPVRWVGEGRDRPSRLRAIVRELRRDPVDVVQSQHFYTNLYGSLAARWAGIPEIGAIRNAVRTEIRAVGAFLGRLSLKVPRLIAANSDAAIREATAMGVAPARLVHLPNVVDTEHFSPAPDPRPRQGDRAIRLLAVGRLVPQKRFDRFVDLLARLRQELGPHTEVVGRILGSGPLRDDLSRRALGKGLPAEALSIDEAIPDVRGAYRQADALVLTSDAEGSPNVALEAMACGLPVVAARVGGVGEILRSGETGLLGEPGDEESFLSALRSLVADPDLRARIGQNARQDAVQRFSLHQLPAMLERLYKRALA